MQIPMSDVEFEKMLASIDGDMSGGIGYNEFVGAFGDEVVGRAHTSRTDGVAHQDRPVVTAQK
jgi:hypothetical protein